MGNSGRCIHKKARSYAGLRTLLISVDADLAPWAGLEPATSRLGGGRSIQLSYQGVLA